MGHGKKKGGDAKCQKVRFEALDRVRAVAELSHEQQNDWEHFKREWDAKLAEIHGEEWAQLFAEQLQNVLGELENGRTNALSDFMHRETLRVLAEVPVLMLPGVPRGDGGKSKK